MQKPRPLRSKNLWFVLSIILETLLLLLLFTLWFAAAFIQRKWEKSQIAAPTRGNVFTINLIVETLLHQPKFSPWLHRAVIFWKEIKGCGRPSGKHGLGKTKSSFKEDEGEVLVYWSMVYLKWIFIYISALLLNSQFHRFHRTLPEKKKKKKGLFHC